MENYEDGIEMIKLSLKSLFSPNTMDKSVRYLNYPIFAVEMKPSSIFIEQKILY